MKDQTVVTIVESLMAESSRRFSEHEKAIKIRTWTLKLKSLSDDQGWRGLDKALEIEGGFMPSIGDFKQMCLTGAGCNSIQDEGQGAWGLVINHLNHSVSPVFKDTSIAEAIRKMGGWKSLCGMLTEHEAFRKKEFIELYVICRRSGETYPAMLRGTFKDHKFIGYKENDDLRAVIKQIERENESEARLLSIIAQGGQRTRLQLKDTGKT